jgi:hypothetical protein
LLARLLALCAALAATALMPAAASASELIDRNATGVKLEVNAKGQAMLTYRARGRLWHVLAWDAVNAQPPSTTRRQTEFKLDYAGGWGTYRKKLWVGFQNVCRPYTGPQLQWLVTACTAPDGSHWAIQSWQRMLPNYGLAPNAKQAVWELRLSHWNTELPQLDVKLNWAYRRYDHMFGRFTYLGSPVFGFRATPTGNPLDTYGRNLYVDTLNSAYGAGWKRENSFLMHTGSGAFCYGFYSHGARPVGKGERYRATIIGPGVTPDVYWESVAPGAYDRNVDVGFNDLIRTLGSGQCKPN